MICKNLPCNFRCGESMCILLSALSPPTCRTIWLASAWTTGNANGGGVVDCSSGGGGAPMTTVASRPVTTKQLPLNVMVWR